MGEGPHSDLGVGGSSECQLCPVCALLQAVTAARPEVTEHLLAAGRELALAVKAALDGHGPAAEPADERLRRIKID